MTPVISVRHCDRHQHGLDLGLKALARAGLWWTRIVDVYEPPALRCAGPDLALSASCVQSMAVVAEDRAKVPVELDDRRVAEDIHRRFVGETQMPIAQLVGHSPFVEVGDDLIPTVLMSSWMDETGLWRSQPDRLGDGKI